MAMLTLRQVPLRCPGKGRLDWASPTTVPRVWMTAIFVASATYALVMALVTSNHLHRLWGIFAACSYLLAAMVVLAWRSRGVDSALLISLGGAPAAPLILMAGGRMRRPEGRGIYTSAPTSFPTRTPHPPPPPLPPP